MPVRRFFDWNAPFIPTVARFIVREGAKRAASGSRRRLDLGRFAYILPGGRAVRSLEAYLQLEAQQAIDEGLISSDWVPPVLLTVGALPEKLYDPPKPVADQVVALFCKRRALEKFLDSDPRAELLVPNAPDASSPSALLRLAQTFISLDQQLADDRRTFADVASACERRDAPEEAERWRALEALDALSKSELAAIGCVGKNDARENAIRRGLVGGTAFDLHDGQPRLYRILGACDLAKQQVDLIGALGDRVEYWVFAPESEKDRFDEFGRVIPDAWQDVEIPIGDDAVFQVETPAEQGEATALLAMELSKEYAPDGSSWSWNPVAPEQLTVGVPDDEAAPFIEEHLEAIGYSSIRAEGTPASKSRVAVLLRNIAIYLETRSFETLGELLRSPDLNAWLERQWKFEPDPVEEIPENDEPETRIGALERAARLEAELQKEMEAVEESESAGEDASIGEEQTQSRPGGFRGAPLRDFDEYRARFLPQRVSEKWFVHVDEDNEKRNRLYRDLRRATTLIDSLLENFRNDEQGVITRSREQIFDAASGDLNSLKASAVVPFAEDLFSGRFTTTTNQKLRPVKEWAREITRLLRRVYGDFSEKDAWIEEKRSREANAQIRSFFEAVDEILEALDDAQLDEETTGAFAIRTLLRLLDNRRIPPLPGSNAVELQGWLDLLFDDAPYLILTGMCESSVPSPRGGDLFLPNETRRALGMTDAKRAVARDAYLLSALARARDALFVVFGSRSLQGDPRLPSRFLFSVPKDDVPKRIARFFSKNGGDLERLRARQNGVPFPLARQREEEASAVSPLVGATGDPDFDELADKSAREMQMREERLRPRGDDPLKPPVLDLSGRQPPIVMKVTEFEAFLQSPYRYFLRSAFGLRTVATTAVGELSAAEFGTLAHDVLRDFGLDPEIRNSRSEYEIFNYLSKSLDRRVSFAYNEYSSPFVFVQVEQVRARLRAFAEWQAAWRQSGREIRYVESAPKDGGVPYVVDGQTVYIKGRIDRIDYSPAENVWHVFDYKTFDKLDKGSKKEIAGPEIEHNGRDLFTSRIGNSVDKKHRETFRRGMTLPEAFCQKFGLNLESEEKGTRWKNLQLPLYRLLTRKLLAEKENIVDPEIRLGYIVLSNTEVQACGAPWSAKDLQYADATATWVVQTIRRLWKTGKIDPQQRYDPDWNEFILSPLPGGFSDDFAEITLSALD